MKEHYVSYEQSVKLKELGFDWECNRYYTNGYANHDPEDLTRVVKLHYDSPYNHNQVISADGPCYSAPRLDQAAAWMRDKGIDIEINAHQHLDGESIKHQYNFGVLTINGETFANTWYNNYEEALSDAIDTALELLGKEVNNGM